ncbi:uncharacterized protein DC041_0001174, partial [Schistosoma bovis]
ELESVTNVASMQTSHANRNNPDYQNLYQEWSILHENNLLNSVPICTTNSPITRSSFPQSTTAGGSSPGLSSVGTDEMINSDTKVVFANSMTSPIVGSAPVRSNPLSSFPRINSPVSSTNFSTRPTGGGGTVIDSPLRLIRASSSSDVNMPCVRLHAPEYQQQQTNKMRNQRIFQPNQSPQPRIFQPGSQSQLCCSQFQSKPISQSQHPSSSLSPQHHLTVQHRLQLSSRSGITFGSIPNQQYINSHNISASLPVNVNPLLCGIQDSDNNDLNDDKSEHINTANLRAKYGIVVNDRHSVRDLRDPFQALRRDSLCSPLCDNESALKPLYDSQLLQLENLISSQRYAQNKMRDQLVLMEKRYVKASHIFTSVIILQVCEELEEERRKHERDAAQGDDVLVMLEKERERLKSEVDYEKLQNKKLTRDLRRVILSWREQNVLCNKQKFAAVTLIKERKRLSNELASKQKRVAELERSLQQNSLNTKALSPDRTNSDSKMTGTVGSDNNVCCSHQCELLRQKLAEEMETRKAIECSFERFKPNPPQRRSSDMPTSVSPTSNIISSGSILISNSSNHTGATTSGSSQTVVEQCSSRSPSGNVGEKSTTQLSIVPPSTTSPPSRSSTPSPPHNFVACLNQFDIYAYNSEIDDIDNNNNNNVIY